MKHMKKLIAAFLTLTVAFSPCVETVQAAPKVPKSKIFYLYPKGDIRHSNTLDLHISGVSDSKDVTNIKSSNPKIIPNDITMSPDDRLLFHAKKAGKATSLPGGIFLCQSLRPAVKHPARHHRRLFAF